MKFLIQVLFQGKEVIAGFIEASTEQQAASSLGLVKADVAYWMTPELNDGLVHFEQVDRISTRKKFNEFIQQRFNS